MKLSAERLGRGTGWREKGVVRGRPCQTNGSDLENRESRRPGSLLVHRTLMTGRFRREIERSGAGGGQSGPGAHRPE